MSAAEKENALRFGAIAPSARHICVDMQGMFAEPTAWRTPWMRRVLPQVCALTEATADRTIFTRFIPPVRSDEARGTWRRYYEHWRSMTREQLNPSLIELVPELARFVPPAVTVDKATYSPWYRSALPLILEQDAVDTVLISGGESDICVLATLLGAVDRGYRVILVTDAICGSADETHDASMTLYLHRFGQQVETVTTEVALAGLR